MEKQRKDKKFDSIVFCRPVKTREVWFMEGKDVRAKAERADEPGDSAGLEPVLRLGTQLCGHGASAAGHRHDAPVRRLPPASMAGSFGSGADGTAPDLPGSGSAVVCPATGTDGSGKARPDTGCQGDLAADT